MRALAFAAFLAAATSVWLPWWIVRYRSAGVTYESYPVRPFVASELVVTGLPIVSGALVAVAAVLLFVRIAAGSHEHEPAVWRRDLWIAAGLLGTAAASALFWPSQVPFFWGGRDFYDNQTDLSFSETAAPGLGWWFVVVAAILVALAAWRAREMPKTEA